MQTQYEVNNFSRVTLLSNLNSFSFSIARNIWPIYSLQNGTEGSSHNASSIWRAKDHRSPVVTLKPDINFHFLVQISMYTGCSGSACVYACCIVGKMHTCGKICIFSSGFYKQG